MNNQINTAREKLNRLAEVEKCLTETILFVGKIFAVIVTITDVCMVNTTESVATCELIVRTKSCIAYCYLALQVRDLLVSLLLFFCFLNQWKHLIVPQPFQNSVQNINFRSIHYHVRNKDAISGNNKTKMVQFEMNFSVNCGKVRNDEWI